MRASEVTQLTSNYLELFEDKPIFRLIMKGHKQHVMSVPEPLVNRLQAYAPGRPPQVHQASKHPWKVERSNGWLDDG